MHRSWQQHLPVRIPLSPATSRWGDKCSKSNDSCMRSRDYWAWCQGIGILISALQLATVWPQATYVFFLSPNFFIFEMIQSGLDKLRKWCQPLNFMTFLYHSRSQGPFVLDTHWESEKWQLLMDSEPLNSWQGSSWSNRMHPSHSKDVTQR